MSDALRSGASTPAAYSTYARAALGGNWYTIDFPVLLEEMEKRLGKLLPVAQAKLFFAQEVLDPPPRSLREPFLFEKLVLAFSGSVPDFDVWQAPTVNDLLVGVVALTGLLPKPHLSEQVEAYAAAVLLHGGCWSAPPGLEFLDGRLRAYMSRRSEGTLPGRAAVQEVLDKGPDHAPLDVVLQAQVWEGALKAVREAGVAR